TLQPGQTRVNRDGRAVFESDEEFVNFVEHIFRSVVNNMTEVTAGAAARAADDGTQRLYAFQPVMQAIGQTMPLITGTISVEAFTQPPAQEHGHPEGAPAGGNGNEGTEGGTGQPPNMMAIFGRIAQELATGMNQPLGEFLRSMGENIDEGGRGYGHLVTGVVSETLGLNDVIALFNGDRSPLDRARTQIRRYMIENTLNDNARPTENDLRSAAERLAADPLDVLHLLQPVDVGARLRPLDSTGRPIDLIASIVRADQAAVERSLRLVFGVDPCVDANGAEISFGQALMGSVEMYGRQMVCLLNMGFDGQPYGYEAVLRRYIANQQEDRSEMIISWMNESGIPQLRGMVDRFPRLTEADVRPLLVFVDETPTAPSPASMASSENSQASRIDDRTNTMQPPAASSIINSDAAPRSNASSSSQSRPMDDSDQSWKRVLPADWVAVIEEDVERQRSVDQTQRPMSDAYITGMPAKRRKLVMRDRPVLSNGAALESALRETLASAVVESGATPVTGATVDDVVGSAPLGEALIDAFRAQFHDDVRRRLRADPDYDPEKLPATNAYFNP
uniref:Uncharacterized protein n=1 Tax=Plectus sambesii TaxID=2011161 RepID=A0A914W4H4_9BILA